MTQATLRGIDDLPTVQVPEDYPAAMPDFLARMAVEHGPIFKIDWAADRRTVYMIGPEANRFVLQTHREHFSHEQGWTPHIGETLGRGLLNMDAPEHTRHRKMMNPAFTIAYMARYLPIMNRVIAERAHSWLAAGEIDLHQEARKITFDIAAEALIGLPTGPDVDHLRELFFTMLFGGYDPNVESEEQFWQRVMAARGELVGQLLTMIAARRGVAEGELPNDVLAMMVNARDDDGEALSDEQLLAHVNILLVAGHETSTTLSSWLLYLLATHPAYLARVHAELDSLAPDPTQPITLDTIKALRVLSNAVDEAGRLHSPVGNVPRGVLKDFEFNGYTIPAGTHLVYSIAATHRLPQIFANPDVFDPDRFEAPREEDKRAPYALVTFGGGPRICIGVNFAQVEIKALAAHVLRAYTLEPVADQEAVHVYYSPVGAPAHGLRVQVHPRR